MPSITLTKAVPQILKTLTQKIQNAKEANRTPIVIFDLDGTLYDVTIRTFEILRRFAHQPHIQEGFATEAKLLLKNLRRDKIRYSVEQTLNEMGITHYSEHSMEFLQRAIGFWFKNFFTDELIAIDEAYPSALKCVKWFYDQGVRVAYLSGRDVPNMIQGTLRSLEKHGFPHTGNQISVTLKPTYGLDDVLFKRQAVEAYRAEGEVIASFDNEPANVKMFIEEFPDAEHFHFNTHFAKWVHLEGPKLWQIDSFEEVWG